MKNFNIVIEGAVQDMDEDVIRLIGRTIKQRFDGTAVTIKNVTINMESEDK